MKYLLLLLTVFSLTSFTPHPESASLDVSVKYHRTNNKLTFEYSVAASDNRPLTLVVNIYDPTGNQLVEGVMEQSMSLSGSFNGHNTYPKTGTYRVEIKVKDKEQPYVIDIPAKKRRMKVSKSYEL